MAEKVASLYAEIGANTTGLQQGLAGAKKAITGAKTIFDGLKTGMAAAGAATLILKGAFELTAGAAVDYAAQVRDLNRVTGAGAEETSRLIQVADDMTISFGDLEQAARIASKNGIEFTTESLGRLSDQYLALNPGQERAAFLIETFGKNGLEMGKMMELGSADIKGMSAAIDDSLVLTESAVQAARDFEIAQDNLSDAVYGVKVAIGNALVPVLTNVTTSFLTLVTANKTYNGVLSQHEKDVRETSGSYDEYAAEMLRAGLVAKQFEGAEVNLAKAMLDGTLEIQKRPAVLYMLMNSVDALSEVEYDNLAIIKANIGANQAWMDALDKGGVSVKALGDKIHAVAFMDIDGLRTAMGGAVGNEMEDFRTKSGEIVDKMQGVRGQIAELTANPWLTKVQQDELKDLQTEYGNLQTELDETATAHETAMAKISYSLLEARLGIDGFTNAELEVLNNYAGITGLIDEPTRALNESIGKLTTNWEMGKQPVENYMKAIQYLDDAIKDGKISADELNTALGLLNGQQIEVGINISVRGDPIPDFGLTDPDAPIIPGDDDLGPGGGVPGGGPQGGAQGSTYNYNVVINSGASANAVADRLKILEAYGA